MGERERVVALCWLTIAQPGVQAQCVTLVIDKSVLTLALAACPKSLHWTP